MRETYCPVCNDKLTEEEELLWCDNCGNNEDSYTFLEALKTRERNEREFFEDGFDDIGDDVDRW